MKTCMNMGCPAALRTQANDTTVCAGCAGDLVLLPEGSALPAYEAAPAPAPAPAPEVETVTAPTPAPVTETDAPAAERGPSAEENAALLAALRATDEDNAPTSAAPPAPAAETITEPVPSVADLGIQPPPPAVVVAPVVVQTPAAPAAAPTHTPGPVTEVIRNRPAAAPNADPAPPPRPTPIVDNDAIVRAFEAQRRRNEARAAADEDRRERMRPASEPRLTPANDDIDPTRLAPRAQREAARPSTADLRVPTTRSWIWWIAAAVVLIGVFGWWLLKGHSGNGAAPQPAIADVTDTTAPSSSVDSVARSIARNAQNSADRAITGVQQVSGRVTALENQQDGRRGFLVADSLTCEYANFGACVASLMENGDQRLVTAGIISQAEARASAERTCRATGCGAE